MKSLCKSCALASNPESHICSLLILTHTLFNNSTLFLSALLVIQTHCFARCACPSRPFSTRISELELAIDLRQLQPSTLKSQYARARDSQSNLGQCCVYDSRMNGEAEVQKILRLSETIERGENIAEEERSRLRLLCGWFTWLLLFATPIARTSPVV